MFKLNISAFVFGFCLATIALNLNEKKLIVYLAFLGVIAFVNLIKEYREEYNGNQ